MGCCVYCRCWHGLCTDLLRNHPSSGKKHSLAQIPWHPQHQAAYDQIVEALVAPPILKLFDPARPAIARPTCHRAMAVLNDKSNL